MNVSECSSDQSVCLSSSCCVCLFLLVGLSVHPGLCFCMPVPISFSLSILVCLSILLCLCLSVWSICFVLSVSLCLDFVCVLLSLSNLFVCPGLSLSSYFFSLCSVSVCLPVCLGVSVMILCLFDMVYVFVYPSLSVCCSLSVLVCLFVWLDVPVLARFCLSVCPEIPPSSIDLTVVSGCQCYWVVCGKSWVCLKSERRS